MINLNRASNATGRIGRSRIRRRGHRWRRACARAEAPLTTRIAVICRHSCEQRQNSKRHTVRTEFLRVTTLLPAAQAELYQDWQG